MLKRLVASLAAVAGVAAIVVAAPSAAVADYLYCNEQNICYTVIEKPAVDPESNPDPETGFSPGAPQCLLTKTVDGKAQNVEVDCSRGNGDYWSNNRQCYVTLLDPQPAPRQGGSPDGAWYSCDAHPDSNTGIGGALQFWSDTPPPGVTRLSPGQAAARLIRTFQLQGITVGLAPDPNIPGSKSYVGVPIWMWVRNPTPLSFGPYTQTATLGGVTITAEAKVTSILWNMGDGKTVACGGAGTEYKVGFGAVDSPTCGHRYSQTSDDQPGGRYTVTATSQWTVTWTGGGQSGEVPLTATSTTTVDINEIQSVNVD